MKIHGFAQYQILAILIGTHLNHNLIGLWIGNGFQRTIILCFLIDLFSGVRFILKN